LIETILIAPIVVVGILVGLKAFDSFVLEPRRKKSRES